MSSFLDTIVILVFIKIKLKYKFLLLLIFISYSILQLWSTTYIPNTFFLHLNVFNLPVDYNIIT